MVVRYRVAGRLRKLTIWGNSRESTWPTPANTRRKALAAVDSGRDPQGEEGR